MRRALTSFLSSLFIIWLMFFLLAQRNLPGATEFRLFIVDVVQVVLGQKVALSFTGILNTMPQLNFTESLRVPGWSSPSPSGNQPPKSLPSICGKAYVFNDIDGVGGMGHVAFGALTEEAILWGSVDGDAIGVGIGRAKVWDEYYTKYSEHMPTEQEMFEYMARKGYDRVVFQEVRTRCNMRAALSAFQDLLAQALKPGWQNMSYQGFGRNCANATQNVLRAFGERDLPEIANTANWIPNSWVENMIQREWKKIDL